MIWLYVSWVILLIGSSIAFYHQHPEQLNWRKTDVHLSARMRFQLALQAMVSVARYHDRQSDLEPTAENLAAYQRVPVQVLQRMLEALVGDGLLTTSNESPPHYLPAAALERIRVADIFICARDAEDDGQTKNFFIDDSVRTLLNDLQRQLETRVGERSLAELVRDQETGETDENRIVQR